MNTKTPLVAIMVVAAGAMLWAVAGRKPGDETTAASADGSRYSELLAAQQAQDARLDRMEAMLGGIAEAAGVPLPDADGHSAANADQRHGETTPQEMESAREKAMADAEAGFNAEPVSAAWSTRNEKLIADAFSAQSLASKNSPAPRTLEASCRSRTCRIELVYANEREAEEGQLFLFHDIGRVFGQSRPFQRVLPDGSVQTILYATTAPPAPSGQGPHKH